VILTGHKALYCASSGRYEYTLTRSENEEERLGNLSLVLGFLAVKEFERLEDQVKVLARLGYGNREIAKICNTTLATVRTLKSRPKTRRRKKTAGRKT